MAGGGFKPLLRRETSTESLLMWQFPDLECSSGSNPDPPREQLSMAINPALLHDVSSFPGEIPTLCTSNLRHGHHVSEVDAGDEFN